MQALKNKLQVETYDVPKPVAMLIEDMRSFFEHVENKPIRFKTIEELEKELERE